LPEGNILSQFMATLNRTLGLAEAVFFGTGSILGAGIYSIIGKVAGVSGNMIWLSFVIASVTAFMTALSYAELSSQFPKAGGEYVYVKKALNKKIAFIIGFIISLTGIVSGATVSIAFAGYLSMLWEIPMFIAAVAIIGLVFIINSIGIRQSSTVNIIFTLIEFSGLVLVVIVAAPYLGKANLMELPKGGINHILLGAALSYFAYIGFEEIVKLSEETKKPEKNIPRALMIASGIVFIIYIAVAVSAISVIPWNDLGKSKHPLSDVAGAGLGKTGVTVIALIALFATTNTILSNMTGSSRVLMELGKEKPQLRFLSYILPKAKTPLYSLILIAILMIAFAAIGKIEKVALIANFFIFITFLFVNISVMVLRRKTEKKDQPFRIPLNIGNIPVTAMLGTALTVLLLAYSIYGLSEGEM
jgi:basic amino acid/polyamine antiporter, APA family